MLSNQLKPRNVGTGKKHILELAIIGGSPSKSWQISGHSWVIQRAPTQSRLNLAQKMRQKPSNRNKGPGKLESPQTRDRPPCVDTTSAGGSQLRPKPRFKGERISRNCKSLKQYRRR